MNPSYSMHEEKKQAREEAIKKANKEKEKGDAIKLSLQMNLMNGIGNYILINP